MSVRICVRARRAWAALGSVVLLSAGTALAATVTVPASKANYAPDGCSSGWPTVDGQFQNVFSGTTVSVQRQVFSGGIQCEYRTGFDFQLPPAVMQPGVTVNSAVLHIGVMYEIVPGADVISVHAIPGSGAPFVPDDFEVNNPILQVAIPASSSYPAFRDFAVASRIQSLVGNTNDHASFILSVAQWGTSTAWYPNATLVVDYTPADGNPPSLDILTPANGMTVLQGDTVAFSATAHDVEDGNIDAAISWTSSWNGVIGSGPSFSTSSLLAASHVITARATDSQGNTVAKTLNLTVQSTNNLPPTLTVFAPAQNAVFTQGTVISFQAAASDPEDGSRTANIQWTSSINGPIGTGGGFGNGTLSVGSHQILVQVSDTNGNSVTQIVTISVQAPVNTPPSVSISSPANGASLTAGVAFNLAGSASDAQQGSMSASIQWVLDGVTTIANGANATATISAIGSHTITARVTDNGGLTSTQQVSVTVVSAPPPTAPPPTTPPTGYCALSGSSSWEWISSVGSGSVTNVSGNNGGYRDYSSVQFNMVAGSASNPLLLAPGFRSTPYTERWYVYLDLNRDAAFSASELVFQTFSASTVNTTFAIPASASLGATRMRVILSFGLTPPLCGAVSWGEVEDYTVFIQAPGTTPTPPGSGYCTSRGTSSNYEFIQQVFVNGTTRMSGNNGGYGDFTANAAIPLVRGLNNVTLTPGFPGSAYSQRWLLWIDFNRDGVFAMDEGLVGGSGTAPINDVFNVHSSVPSGTTRMRIQMKEGALPAACETFGYGEVEDYTVQIP